MACESLITVSAVTMFIVAGIFSISMLSAFSNFFSLASRMHPALAQELEPEYGDQWSGKNAKLVSFFYEKAYLDLDSAELTMIGDSIRIRALLSIICGITGVLVLAGKTIIGQLLCS